MTDKPRRTRRSTATVRNLILDAARELFSARGYAGATTREIARIAGTNEVLLFRHFNSKAELFERAVFEPFKAFMKDFAARASSGNGEQGVEQETREFEEGLVHLVSANRQLIMAMIATSLYEPEVQQGLADIEGIQEYFVLAESYMHDRNITTGMTLSTGVRLSFVLVAATVLCGDWLFASEGKAKSEARLIEDLSQFINHGFG